MRPGEPRCVPGAGALVSPGSPSPKAADGLPMGAPMDGGGA